MTNTWIRSLRRLSKYARYRSTAAETGRRSLGAPVWLGAAVTAVCIATPAEAGRGNEPIAIPPAPQKVIAHFFDTGVEVPSTFPCVGGVPASSGHATFGTEAGDNWHGVSSYDICVYPSSTPGEFSYYGVETLSGTVDNCGTGTMTWSISGVVTVGAFGDSNVWLLLPGPGTGDLANATGFGQSHSFLAPSFQNFGYFTGTFSCQNK